MDTDAREPRDPEEVLRELVDGIPIALVVLHLADRHDPDSLTLVAANPAATDLAALRPDHFGGPVGDAVAIPEALRSTLAEVVRSGTPCQAPAVNFDGIDGTFSIRAVPLPGDRIGVSLDDVTTRERTARSFRHQATHDHLTGLANRALLSERLELALRRRTGHGSPVALLLVDLDRFKDVNDSLGHQYGDALLHELGRRLRTRLRGCDTVARLGGDEFAVLLTADASGTAATSLARRVVEIVEEPVALDGYRLQVSASIGIALAPTHGEDAATILVHADAAMYEAKAAGGGYRTFRDEDGDDDRRRQLLADLRTDGFGADLEVWFQPRIDLRTLETVGAEALVRWRHPRYGTLRPDEFVELAEVTGGIRELGRIVCSAATDLLRRGPGSHLRSVSINVSTRNLLDHAWVEEVCRSVGSSDTTGRLWMEITERQLMESPRRIGDVLHHLHDAGIRFSLDDFGTGASSLALIRDLPFVEVKIAPRFVEELRNGEDRLTRSIIDLGHHLGLVVTAEGVADVDAVETLRTMGCDLGQGFALAEPLSLEELVEHLSRQPVDPSATTWKLPVTDG